jgi:transposase
MRARDDARRNVTSAREAAQDADYAPLVAQLCVLRGIDVLSAMMILTELGDLRRFGSAHQVMAAVGLVPIEYSTGASAGVHRVGNRSIGGKEAHDRRSLAAA